MIGRGHLFKLAVVRDSVTPDIGQPRSPVPQQLGQADDSLTGPPVPGQSKPDAAKPSQRRAIKAKRPAVVATPAVSSTHNDDNIRLQILLQFRLVLWRPLQMRQLVIILDSGILGLHLPEPSVKLAVDLLILMNVVFHHVVLIIASMRWSKQ
uniref:Uncharacterized protein n=1 Tax=Panagrolaimus sp. ES5 TaxID=591445 RepID=A0AC34FVR5_9BILA